MKKYLLPLSLLIVIGAIIGFKTYHKPHQNMEKAKASYALTANELFAAFESDEAAANINYLDKVIAVKGKVRETKEEDGNVKIMLETDDLMFGVSCQLDNLSKHKRKAFKPGEEVSFKGKCTGVLMDVVMVRCVEI